jgi:hypothetical protein
MQAEIEAAYAAWRQNAERALLATAAEVLEQAKRDCPYDPDEAGTGEGVHLRDTGHLEPIRYTAGGIMAVEIVFDGPYAARQHERLDYQHPHGGKAKFLEHNLTGARLLEALARAESGVFR